MKVIGVGGSPRKGNTEWMLTTLLDELKQRGADTEMVLLRKIDLKMCRGCLACEKGGKARKGECAIKDDMAALYPKLIAADAVVLATPVYMEMLSGLLKVFLDRTCAIWPRLKGKRIAGLAAAEDSAGQTMRNLKGYAALCKMQWTGGVIVLAKNPGDAAKVPGLDKRLERLARRLAGA
jgi:multimeric flavodoxin WrbA